MMTTMKYCSALVKSLAILPQKVTEVILASLQVKTPKRREYQGVHRIC